MGHSRALAHTTVTSTAGSRPAYGHSRTLAQASGSFGRRTAIDYGHLVAVRLCLVLVLALGGCGGGGEENARTRASSSGAPASPQPIVVDTDLGADDIPALALLLQSTAVDVRAITVSGTGLVRCPIGARHVRGMQDLLNQHPQAVARIARIHAMAGAIQVAGNAPGGAEWNVRADPSAFTNVVGTVPTTLIPLDATNAVPLDAAFFDRLSADTSAPAANLTWRLLDKNRFLLTSGQSLWDELAAIALVEPSLLNVQPVRIGVGPTGKITTTPSGLKIDAAMSVADSAAKTAILGALRNASASGP